MASNANDQDVAVSGPRQRKQEGIKRACNECRQQKLRCDVVSNPFQACSRCRRLRLVCKIDAGFKRVEKRRAKHARQQLDAAQLAQSHRRDSGAIASPPATASRTVTTVADESAPEPSPTTLDLPTVPTVSRDSAGGLQSTGSRVSTYPAQRIRSESEPSVSSERLRSSSINKDSSAPSIVDTVRVLDGVELNKVDVDALLKIFFAHYHPFLPFLEPSMGADFYYRSSRLLFWAIMSVASRRYAADLTLLPALAISVPRLMWSTLQRVSQNYHDVKGLCLLCIWPFPRSSSASDPSFMLGGTLVSVAMHLGLHKPHQPMDFSQFTKRILPDELQDRITTWAACKIVSQRIATGYGQSLALVFDESPISSALSNDMRNQLKIEGLCTQISKTAFVMSETLTDEGYDHHLLVIDDLARELACIEGGFADQSNPVLFLYVHCARLHLRLHVLHQPAGSPNYISSALSLYDACNNLTLFVENSDIDILSHCPNYVYQMILAAGFAVLRLCTSPMIEALDASAAKKLFNSCISAVRKMCITNNDLPGRSSEVLAQLKARRNRSLRELTADWNSVQLKVRGRSSMSISYDSLWEWRGGFVDDEHGPVADNEAPNGAIRQSYVSPHAEQSLRDGESASSLPTDQNFALNDMNLDQFYPWMLENATELASFPNLNGFTT